MNVENGETLQLLKRLEVMVSFVIAVTISKDGSKIVKLVSGSWDNIIKIWDVPSGNLLETFEGHTNHENSLCLSPDQSKIVSASDDFTMKMWDFSSGKLLKSLKYDNYVANSICYSPNGSYIASNYGKDIKLWDALFNPLMTLLGHLQTAFSIRFSWG